MIKLVLTGIAITVVFAAVVLALLFLFQGRLLYPAPPYQVPSDLPPGIERIELSDGYAFYMQAVSNNAAPGPVMIFTHGNGEVAWLWTSSFAEVLEAGISVMLVEYPGYGGAGGRPSLQSIRRGILAAYDHLQQRPDVDPDQIVAWGRSIGGGAVGLLALERPLAALAFESSFSTMSALVAEKGFPAALLRDRYDNLAAASLENLPLFIVHGTHDTLIPFHHAKQLAAANKRATLLPVNCGHNDCPRVWTQWLAFLKSTTTLFSDKHHTP